MAFLYGSLHFLESKYLQTAVLLCLANQYFMIGKRGPTLFFIYFKHSVVKTTLLTKAKYLKVFDTSIFLKTKVFLEYLKNTELSNQSRVQMYNMFLFLEGIYEHIIFS